MPHRVVDFFRSSNDSIHNIKASVQRRSNPRSRSASRDRSTRHSSLSSHDDDAARPAASLARMADLTKDKHKDSHSHHRLSFPGLHLGSSRSKDATQNASASLDWKIESPPVVMHGDAENSTGALVSGQLYLCVKEDNFEVESFEAKLEIHVTQKRPYASHCQNCSSQTSELKTWSFLADPTILSKRTHEFPFSVLLEGHLPATTDNPVVAIRYEFTAEARPRAGLGPAVRLVRTIDVKRSLPVPELPHHSVRIFPPTNIAASVHYAQVVHPSSTNTFTLRLDGIVRSNPDSKSVEYWKLKRLSWKVEEHMEAVAPACDKHAPKDPDSGSTNSNSSGSKKGAKRTDARVIAHADLHSGWKSDYSPTGSIDMEVQYELGPVSSASSSSRAASGASGTGCCDLKSADGTRVTHQLVVEMVVVQEYAPAAHPRHIAPTGVARILRMHFGVALTERAGLGVSWDNEAPPIYQDVPPSPPSYSCSIPFDTIETVEELSLSPGAGIARLSHEIPRGQSPPYEERPSPVLSPPLPPPAPSPSSSTGGDGR
ncbi:hypothetical protein GGS23DRAFT_1370 [Durotheca rogersii]|uniref:uncharacterized protein n=1 Tax=Durotheca rogersii TaxID=419775 RepID=UPI00221FA90B|nr:uncharacterized protein GGS23DRAFT_1370 [Durotheca rogersii]KAI5867911.1 hypothetical protein GGS23DRAFT_1370 [Durotheca rogersii]